MLKEVERDRCEFGCLPSVWVAGAVTGGRPDPRSPSLSQEQLVELMALLPGSDSVELKLTVPESHHRSTVIGLGMDPLEAQIRTVVFFDTPDLMLDRHGVVVRARRVQGKGDDSVVKLRPVVPSQLPSDVRAAPEFSVEVDALPGGFVCSGMMKRVLDRKKASVRSVVAGEMRISKLFSKRQRSLFSSYAPSGIELDDLTVLGPIFVLKLRFMPPEFAHRLVAEVWLYPDGSRVLELSTKTTPDDAFRLASKMRAYLVDRGVDLTGAQQTKTRKALEYFAAATAQEMPAAPQPEVVPRWEWRTFAPALQLPDDAQSLLEPGEVVESDEVYLLSATSDASVKVRGNVLDVKELDERSDDGLELWRPVLKAPLPTTGADVMPLRVHKTRRRFSGAGCMAELTTLTAGGQSVETVAVEAEDPAAVVALVERLGFRLDQNTNMARGLKQLISQPLTRYAAIDVGTNSVKLHIAERSHDDGLTTVVDRSEITRLGEGLEGAGELQPEPMRRTLDAIAGMADDAHRLGVAEIVAVGTAGMRIASNSADFVRAVEERTGVSIKVISGEEESRLAYLAVKAGIGLGDGRVVVFDTGGGSSQFTFGSGDEVEERFSVNVGAVRLTEQFGLDAAVPVEVVAEAQAAIAADLSSLDRRSTPDALIALGGVITNMAAVKHALAAYDADVVQGTVLDQAEVDRQIKLYRTRTADERREIVGLQPKRAEVVLAGACIVRVVMKKLGRETLVVSDRGLRHGLLLDRYGE